MCSRRCVRCGRCFAIFSSFERAELAFPHFDVLSAFYRFQKRMVFTQHSIDEDRTLPPYWESGKVFKQSGILCGVMIVVIVEVFNKCARRWGDLYRFIRQSSFILPQVGRWRRHRSWQSTWIVSIFQSVRYCYQSLHSLSVFASLFMHSEDKNSLMRLMRYIFHSVCSKVGIRKNIILLWREMSNFRNVNYYSS